MSGLRYRRNINCLSGEALHDLREALAAMYVLPASSGHGFAKIAGLHGQPSPFYCEHGYPGFLTWHRAYLDAFQHALACVDSDVTLPYWDWSVGPTTGVPAACSQPTYVNRSGDTVPNPLYSGPAFGGGQTSRAGDIDTRAFGDIAASAQSAMSSSNFSGFQSALNGPHGSVHIRVSGDMSSVATAGYDPIFYLHHANVDRLWAQWQKSHPAPLPGNEKSKELEPFYRAFSTDLMRGEDVESTDQLGYRYTSFCVFRPPFLREDLLVLKLDPRWFRPRRRVAKLILQSGKMAAHSMDLRAFVNDARAGAGTATVGNPAYAGTFGVFGMGMSMDADGAMNLRRAGDARYDLEIDISDGLEAMQAHAEKEEVFLNLVPVGPDGKSLSLDLVESDGFELLLK